ncbi:speckle-type POZ protein-like [Musca autumnalis]|uniref:speckle-type POZ protein-like n=1 Tax=Musca autumnalis TaxID=221902 RepID=UPI003CFA1C8A
MMEYSKYSVIKGQRHTIQIPSEKLESFSYDTLKLLLEIKSTNICHETIPVSEGLHTISNLVNDFSKFLDKEEFTDDTLIARNGTEFKAHKSILCARSEVFAAMFRNDTLEAKTNRVTIDDMDAETIQEMLKFMYSAKEVSKNLTTKLLPAADKYALLDLRTMCEKRLMETISVNSVVDSLSISRTILPR